LHPVAAKRQAYLDMISLCGRLVESLVQLIPGEATNWSVSATDDRRMEEFRLTEAGAGLGGRVRWEMLADLGRTVPLTELTCQRR
jgi:hypothetical protein